MIDISSTSARYNWWTPEHQKQDISPLTGLASIMQYGDAREVFEVFRGYDGEILTQAYSRIAGDTI